MHQEFGGSNMTKSEVPFIIFQVGSSNKDVLSTTQKFKFLRTRTSRLGLSSRLNHTSSAIVLGQNDFF